MEFKTLDDVEISGKRVLIREDFNVPIVAGVVQSEARIRAALPTIQRAVNAGAQVRLMSHLGRPEGPDPRFSLQPVAAYLMSILGYGVDLVTELRESDAPLVLYENVRFFSGETTNDPQLAKKMAALCDVFVMDAFGSAHRAHASTVGVCEYAPMAVAGPLLVREIQALDRVMQNPQRPLVVIIGGAKVSSKLEVLKALLAKTDYLIVGGGMANTFLAAQGMDVKNSLYEPDMLDYAEELLKQYKNKLLLPIDYIWDETNRIVDIGPQSCKKFADIILQASTILWNGPMGVFEDPRFANGTLDVAKSVSRSNAFSVAGGGDTLAAIEKIQLVNPISYISTGGGAFLEYVEGKTLPAIQALITKSK